MAVSPKTAPLTLDELDLGLIRELARDGRRPLTELAPILGVSHGTVRNRLERLLSNGVIRISAVVEPARVGFPTQVLIGIHTDLGHLEETEQQLPQFEEVAFVTTLTGRLDFLIGAVFTSEAHLREFLVHKLSRIKGIRGTETFHVLDQGKYVWQWEIPKRMEAKVQDLRPARGARP